MVHKKIKTGSLFLGIIFLGICVCILIYIQNQSHHIENFDTNSVISNNIDVVYYINLDKRQDRNTQVLEEIDKMRLPKDKVIRVPAKYIKDFGALGCSYSHVDCLQRFIESGKQTCIILEDDFEFKFDQETIHQNFAQFFDANINYDVCMLSINPVKLEDSQYLFLNKVIDAQTTAGYMVNKKFAKKLLDNFIEGAELLKESGYDKYHLYGIDQYWKKLQPSANWYAFNPILGKQRESYSDIAMQNVDYGI
jgi:GR25 family glycosyltransferase involved in LPS biosynthesis